MGVVSFCQRITCFRISFKFTAFPRGGSSGILGLSGPEKGRWARATNDEGGGERISPFAHCHHQHTSTPPAHAFIPHNERRTCPTVAIQLTRPAILRFLDSLADCALFPSRFPSAPGPTSYSCAPRSDSGAPAGASLTVRGVVVLKRSAFSGLQALRGRMLPSAPSI